MYCPNCAAAYSYGLRYCKQCGTNLGEGPQTSTLPPPAPAPKVTGAAWALAMATVAIVLGGAPGLALNRNSKIAEMRIDADGNMVTGSKTVQVEVKEQLDSTQR